MNSSERTTKRRRKPPPRYFSSKYQRKLLGMMFLLMLVILLMRMVAKPENWNWFFILSTPQQKQQQTQEPENSDKDEIASRKKEQLPLVAPRPGILPFADVIDADSLAIPQRVFEGVVDWTEKNRVLNVTVNEAWAYYALLKKIRTYSPEQLGKEVQHPVSYSVLNEFAPDYRGKIFHFRGVVRKCRKIPFGDVRQRRYDLEHLYEVWLTTPDSGNRLYRVVFTELPRGLLTSDEPFDTSKPVDVQVTGYFFKIQGYSTLSEQQGAPLFLARSLDLIPAAVAGDWDLGLVPYVVVFAVVIAGAVGITVWRYRKSDREFEAGYKKKMREVAPENLELLQQVRTVNPEDVLKELSEDETKVDRSEEPSHEG